MASYRERVSWPLWFHVATALVGIATLGVLAEGAISRGQHAFALLAAAPILLVGYALWRMRHIEIEFGPDGAAFGFGGLRNRVPRGRIRSVEAKDYPLARYMGWGYRIGWEPGERAYSVIGCRRGVVLDYEDERGRRRKVFLSCRDPEAARAALLS